jgi:hypothetical protein
MKILTSKKILQLKEYIVEVEKELATDNLKAMGGEDKDKDLMYDQGCYDTLKNVCKLLGIKYSFCIK